LHQSPLADRFVAEPERRGQIVTLYGRAGASRARPSGARMHTLYYATNTCALASHIALEKAGTAFETRWIDFAPRNRRSLSIRLLARARSR
jgi:hypothetical protein